MKRLPRALVARIVGGYRSARIRFSQSAAPIEDLPRRPRTGPHAGMTGRFDGERAFALLREQCAQGPRVPDTPGHAATRDLVIRELSAWCDTVALQRWRQPIRRGPGAGTAPDLTNIFALVRGREDRELPLERVRAELMLCAHWDTRPVADNDPDPARRTEPVPGASDGASGAAVLLEAARALHAEPPAASVLLAFWDGEDLGEYYYGSRLYARQSRHAANARWRPRRAVLLDMIGGRGLRCTTEGNSLRSAPGLWSEVHAAAGRLGVEHHFLGPRWTIMDDHVFLNRAGIPSIVLIDYSYPHWHTAADTVDKCAPESLQAVGDVVLAVVRGEGRT